VLPLVLEQRSPHEGSTGTDKRSAQKIERQNRLNRNPEEQGRQGNIKQNTAQGGYQQNR
jgi:hypothetical protein